MIITIGRECGCDGDEVAARLASKYGIACYTKKEIIRLARVCMTNIRFSLERRL